MESRGWPPPRKLSNVDIWSRSHAESAPLMEQIVSALRRSEREAREAARLQELSYLLEKNPDVSRILDLLGFEPRFRW